MTGQRFSEVGPGLAGGRMAKEKYKGVVPTKLDHKGQYGVAIVWSDGHYADIFPYDVLKGIAEEVKEGESSV